MSQSNTLCTGRFTSFPQWQEDPRISDSCWIHLVILCLRLLSTGRVKG